MSCSTFIDSQLLEVSSSIYHQVIVFFPDEISDSHKTRSHALNIATIMTCLLVTRWGMNAGQPYFYNNAMRQKGRQFKKGGLSGIGLDLSSIP